MAFHQSSKRIVRRCLDPADRLQEVLCGLIMVLEFTLIGGLTASDEKHGVRILLIGALGCNIAWGIIDGPLIATLFAVGFMWGKYIHINRYVTAGCAVLIGLALAGVAIELGG